MLHCPNCGSSAQFKTSTPMYFEDGVWKQQKKCGCGCGCTTIIRYYEECERLVYPSGNEILFINDKERTINKTMENK